MITRFTRELLQLHSEYKDRILIYGGGSYDQPSVYIEAMRYIDSLIDEVKSNS